MYNIGVTRKITTPAQTAELRNGDKAGRQPAIPAGRETQLRTVFDKIQVNSAAKLMRPTFARSGYFGRIGEVKGVLLRGRSQRTGNNWQPAEHGSDSQKNADLQREGRL